jgi:uncharacterized protein
MSRLFRASHRSLQQRFDTERLANRIEDRLLRDHVDADNKAFIERLDMFFLATADASGRPNCSFKGGDPGFVRMLEPRTLMFPCYDGNGMFLSMGNIAGDGRIGLLFMDFDEPRRLRAHAHAVVSADDPMMQDYPDADLVVRATVLDLFTNCPRYITPHNT